MSAALIVFAAVLLAAELRWSVHMLAQLSYEVQLDRTLAEPGEEITLTGTVANHGRLPAGFVWLQNELPPEAGMADEKEPGIGRVRRGRTRTVVEDRFSVRGRRAVTRTIAFTLPRRGRYQVGGYTLAAGDLLGLTERSSHGENGQQLVVMPALVTDEGLQKLVGGFLGDISVRRFLMEDPVLTVGFRDYTGREPFRAISWTRTAVAGSLQVKEYDHTAEPMATVILNVYGGTEAELEQCFRLTRMACELLERQRLPYAFYTNGSLIGPLGRVAFLPSGLGAQHLQTILYGLGCASYTCFYSFATLAARVQKGRKDQENYLVITPPLDDAGEEILRELEQRSSGPVCVLVGKEDMK